MYRNIKSAKSLVTTKEMVKKGFINFAIKRNEILEPFINDAKKFSKKYTNMKNKKDLLNNFRDELIDAAGFSVKSRKFLTDKDIDEFLKSFLDKFSSKNISEIKEDIIFRYLLTRGDALGGKMRNIIGNLGEIKFISFLLDNLREKKLKTKIIFKDKSIVEKIRSNIQINDIKYIGWQIKNKNRVMAFNLNIPITKKNIDVVVFDAKISNFVNNLEYLKKEPKKYTVLGELKGGIDPAGADEHWKTASTSLYRIRDSFKKKEAKIYTFFVGAAIENSMSIEIFNLYENDKKFNCANLNNDQQLKSLSNWIIDN